MTIFNKSGDVLELPKEVDGQTTDSSRKAPKKSRYSPTVIKAIEGYLRTNPCFYLEELQEWMHFNFPEVHNTSLPTLCRALKHDMGLSRKVCVLVQWLLKTLLIS